MLFNNAPFGQVKDSVVINIYVETTNLETLVPPPGNNFLLDNTGNYLMDNTGVPLL